jgi:hypothetical protein
MVAVTFDYPLFVARYPEFNQLPAALAQLYFNEASLYCDNTGAGFVTDAGQQTLLMMMATAHIAYINAPTTQGGSGSSLVGRISDATEGSVSVSTDYGTQSASAAFWLQSKYGAAFWKATGQYRTSLYIPPTTPAGGVSYGGGLGLDYGPWGGLGGPWVGGRWH